MQPSKEFVIWHIILIYPTDGPGNHIYDDPSDTGAQHLEKAIHMTENPAYATVTDYYDAV